MKKVSVILTLITVSMSSFTLKKPAESSGQMAQHVLLSFQHGIPSEFVAQFPTLNEFHQWMDATSEVYGDFLLEAKAEFQKEYESHLLPEATEAFQTILLQGKKKGIDWNVIRYVRTEAGSTSDSQTAALTIVFSSHGKEFRLIVEDAIRINNQWKVSQHLHLI